MTNQISADLLQNTSRPEGAMTALGMSHMQIHVECKDSIDVYMAPVCMCNIPEAAQHTCKVRLER